jgi:NADH-quinone oxidoreductase subunit C
MSDDKPITPPEPTPPAEEEKTLEKTSGAPETPAPTADDTGKAPAGAGETKSEEQAPAKDPWEEKPVPPQHEQATDDPDAAALEGEMPGVVVASDRFAGEVTLTVPAARIVEVCRFLKHDCDYKFLVDLTAVDWPEREEGRFDVVYWLHRHDDSKRLRLRAVLGEDDPIDSVTGVWKVANWMEREAYDLFGIRFEGHPSLERILTWEGFNGHPLRKDFPVEGIDTGAAIYPEVYPPGGGPPPEEEVDEKGGAE